MIILNKNGMDKHDIKIGKKNMKVLTEYVDISMCFFENKNKRTAKAANNK